MSGEQPHPSDLGSPGTDVGYETIYAEHVTKELDAWKDAHDGVEPKFRVRAQRWSEVYTTRWVDDVELYSVSIDSTNEERTHG